MLKKAKFIASALHWFRDLRLTYKFGLLLAIMLINVIAVGAMGVGQLQMLGHLADEMERAQALPQDRIKRVERALFQSRMILFDHFAEFDRSKMQQINKLFLQSTQELDKLLAEAGSVFPSEAAATLQGAQASWAAFKEGGVKAMALGEEFDKEESLYLLYGDNHKQFLQILTTIQEVSGKLHKIAEDAYLRGQELRGGAVRNLAILAVLGALVTFGLLVFIARLIAKPLQAVSEVVRHVATGDLTRLSSVEGSDEIGVLGHSVDAMSGSLRSIVTDLADHAGTVATSSNQLAVITNQIAGKGQTLMQQSASVSGASGQLAETVRSMAETVERLSSNVRSISEAAQDSSNRMNAVNGAVDDINASITRIAAAAESASGVAQQAMERSDSAALTMRQLGEAAREIGAVTDAIKRIAHQTNLLALNANIEAASAGKAGAGFAVVANAIKALARQSAQSAQEIATRIASIQERTGGAVAAIAEMTSIIEAINRSVSDITSAVSEQGRAAAGITANILEAAKSSQEQAAAIAEISKGTQNMATDLNQASQSASVVSSTIDDVHRAVGQVAEEIERITGTMSELARVGTGLKGVVNQFHTN